MTGAPASPSGSRPSDQAATRPDAPRFDPSRKDISNGAKCIVGGWFAKMRPGKGELTFGLGESKPRAWVAAALRELVAADVIAVRAFNEYGGLVFTPLVDCHPAFVWMMRGGSKTPEAKLPLTEPVKSRQDGVKFQRDFLASIETPNDGSIPSDD